MESRTLATEPEPREPQDAVQRLLAAGAYADRDAPPGMLRLWQCTDARCLLGKARQPVSFPPSRDGRDASAARLGRHQQARGHTGARSILIPWLAPALPEENNEG